MEDGEVDEEPFNVHPTTPYLSNYDFVFFAVSLFLFFVRTLAGVISSQIYLFSENINHMIASRYGFSWTRLPPGTRTVDSTYYGLKIRLAE